MSSAETSVKNTSIPYLIYTFGLGLLIIGVLIYLGYTNEPFLISISIGAVAQVLFRVTKRMWSNRLNRHRTDVMTPKNPMIQGIVDTLPTFKVFGLLYIAMLFVSALWFGIGRGVGWLFG
ncbi:hypothetical protein [Alteromonas sp. W364]|uniref:hypothetical protein n=1 Tax=Alteromonas sp. W364 TaxID=3075610 RepID=UPI0028880E90|nr:hypothetical protein [Alteromonas sp. W364]MDT0630089.1 hypothetical protein [Alteromonas sp. W364]